MKWIICGAVLGAAPLACADGETETTHSTLEWGIYQIYWGGRRYKPTLAKQLERLATRPDYVMFYRDLPRSFPKTGIGIIHEAGATPIISLELWRWHDSRTRQLPRIVEGEFDEHFRQWATDAKTDGRRVVLRFGFEFNGDWFSWGGDPERFVTAWRRIRKIFDDAGATNVEWAWCPNITSHPDGPANNMHRYYPGDEYVDWVGIDGYNWGDDYREWHRWLSFEELFQRLVDEFARRYPAKPLMIAEFGCPEGKPGQKADWIRQAHAFACSRPQIKAMVWFNYNKSSENELDFRIDTTAESLKAFNETFAARRQTPDGE